ncbi:hypothetical protein ACS0TY_017605 [Phlomoides rotata]
MTQYPNSCTTSLRNSNSSDPEEIFRYSLMVVMKSLEKIASFPDEFVTRTDNQWVCFALRVYWYDGWGGRDDERREEGGGRPARRGRWPIYYG